MNFRYVKTETVNSSKYQCLRVMGLNIFQVYDLEKMGVIDPRMLFVDEICKTPNSMLHMGNLSFQGESFDEYLKPTHEINHYSIITGFHSSIWYKLDGQSMGHIVDIKGKLIDAFDTTSLRYVQLCDALAIYCGSKNTISIPKFIDSFPKSSNVNTVVPHLLDQFAFVCTTSGDNQMFKIFYSDGSFLPRLNQIILKCESQITRFLEKHCLQCATWHELECCYELEPAIQSNLQNQSIIETLLISRDY